MTCGHSTKAHDFQQAPGPELAEGQPTQHFAKYPGVAGACFKVLGG